MNKARRTDEASKENCCCDFSCGQKPQAQKAQYITDWIDTQGGQVPRLTTRLSKKDKWEHFKVRLTINRMNYKVEPGIYALGSPGPDSVILVSANYKLSFDALRKELGGLDAWILVLDTKGINVWCAAGKGTFGTAELVNRIELTQLRKIVKHRKLILPQLCASGVAAHTVKKLSGFTAIFGPVRAADIPAFLAAGMKAEPEMRQVRFSLVDRLALVPVEVVQGSRYLLLIMGIFLVFSGLNKGGYSLDLMGSIGMRAGVNLLLAFLAGSVLGPLFLPWLPGRSFSAKGAFIGIILFAVSYISRLAGTGLWEILAWLLLIPALSSFAVMNFTGGSPYTSLSGVKREMRIAVPIQMSAVIPGCLLWLVGRFIFL